MALEYVGGLPDWCGEAANRRRLEEWYESFGAGGIPCAVCELRKLSEDFRKLSQHLAAGKEKVTVKQAAGRSPRTWAVNLLSAPPAVLDGRRSPGMELLHLQLTCSRCRHVLLFDARGIGIAV